MVRDFYLPYLINYSQPVVEDITIFCVAALTAIVVSAEGQAFVATLLGDYREGTKDRFHFNVFCHMSVIGTLSFFIAGFGWCKEINIDTKNFKDYPRLFLIISRIAGPLANLLMANIAASISWIFSRYDFEDKVFSTIVVVNITMAVYGLVILPLLPGGSIVTQMRKTLYTFGPFLIVLSFLFIRLSGWEGISLFFNPIVSRLASFLLAA